jgi:hypothetical protein
MFRLGFFIFPRIYTLYFTPPFKSEHISYSVLQTREVQVCLPAKGG